MAPAQSKGVQELKKINHQTLPKSVLHKKVMKFESRNMFFKLESFFFVFGFFFITPFPLHFKDDF